MQWNPKRKASLGNAYREPTTCRGPELALLPALSDFYSSCPQMTKQRSRSPQVSTVTASDPQRCFHHL